VDIHWVRFERAFNLQRRPELQEKALYYRTVEGINARCADLTLTVTDVDRKFFLDLDAGLKIEVIPTIHETLPPEKPFADRKDLMFIGGFYHQPNVDAVLFFAKDILPLIREKIPGVKFFVAGSNPPPEVRKLSGGDISVTGYVRDVRPFFESCRVFVAPLRYGAGMKGKIGQSMSYGLPLVTTTMGSEGMGLADGQNALIADSPGDFADAVTRLYTDEALWNRISVKSVSHIEVPGSDQC